MEFCIACRSIPTLSVRVEGPSPRSLWCPRRWQIPLESPGPGGCITSRVPVVRALRLTWALPIEILIQSASIDLWASSEYLLLTGSVSAASLATVTWPQGLKHVSFGDDFNQPIIEVGWAAWLQQMSFGRNFDQPIAGVVWPAA